MSWLFAIIATFDVTKVVFYIGGASTIRQQATILFLILELHTISLKAATLKV